MPHQSPAGAVAQLGERRLCKADVRGSSPLGSTSCLGGTAARGEHHGRGEGLDNYSQPCYDAQAACGRAAFVWPSTWVLHGASEPVTKPVVSVY